MTPNTPDYSARLFDSHEQPVTNARCWVDHLRRAALTDAIGPIPLASVSSHHDYYVNKRVHLAVTLESPESGRGSNSVKRR